MVDETTAAEEFEPKGSTDHNSVQGLGTVGDTSHHLTDGLTSNPHMAHFQRSGYNQPRGRFAGERDHRPQDRNVADYAPLTVRYTDKEVMEKTHKVSDVFQIVPMICNDRKLQFLPEHFEPAIYRDPMEPLSMSQLNELVDLVMAQVHDFNRNLRFQSPLAPKAKNMNQLPQAVTEDL